MSKFSHEPIAPFIRRAVATILLTFGVAAAGGLAFFQLPVAPPAPGGFSHHFGEAATVTSWDDAHVTVRWPPFPIEVYTLQQFVNQPCSRCE